MRRTDGDGNAGGDHAVGPEHADGEIRDVHRAALAFVGAASAPEQLAHHRRGVGALGERVAVAAVRRGEIVAAREVRAHARRDRFLARGQMQRPAHQRGRAGSGAEHGDAAAAGLFSGILEGADARHGAVQGEQMFGRGFVHGGDAGRQRGCGIVLVQDGVV